MDNENVSIGLRGPGLFGKKPLIGLLMFIIGGLIFAILAYNLVTNGLLIKWDLPFAESLHTFALKSSPLLTDIMISGYYVGELGIIIIAVLLALYFLYKRFWKEIVMIIASLGISPLIFLILSHTFNRSRPSILFATKIWAGNLTIAGFPSGHAQSTLICFGLLIYLFLPKIKSHFGKFLAVLAALLIVLYVGFGRLYVGDHYLTDVIAGYAVGIAWFGISVTVVELLFKKYKNRKEKEKSNLSMEIRKKNG